ncbi:MAG TPA: hypothetical protein VLB85_02915 [Acidimicrobiia bacterium]|nr:hypothetical protein [Acidimicrobiia bacterium]
MRLEPILTQIDTSLEAQLRWADPGVTEMAAGVVDALRPAIRGAMLEVAQQAAAEIGAQLGDRQVEVRLVEGDPEMVVSSVDLPPAPPTPPDAPGAPGDEMEARITLRLPSNLKGLIEEAANTSGDSINSWVIDALKSRTRRYSTGSRVEETFQL